MSHERNESYLRMLYVCPILGIASAFVQRVTRDERRQRALLHKCQGDKLLEMLNSVLMMPNCPGNDVVRTPRAVRQVSTPPSGATTGGRTSQIPRLRARRGARINAVGAASPNLTNTSGSGGARTSGGSSDRTGSEECYDYEQGATDEDVPEPFTNYEEACVNLLQIEVPDREDTPSNMLTYDNYRRAVLAIRENPNAAYLPNCIVCRGQHRFENCPTLNDHDFLKCTAFDSARMFAETKPSSPNKGLSQSTSWTSDTLMITRNPIAATVIRIFLTAAAKFVAAPLYLKRQA